MMRYAKEGVGEAIVDIVGSINVIDVARGSAPTMLANYGHIPATLKTPREIYDAAMKVKSEVAGLGGREELYINGMVDAFAMYARTLEGDKIPYKDAIKVMQQVDLAPIPQSDYDTLASRIGESLGKLGYTGTVGQQVSAWLKDTAIVPEQVGDVAMQFLGKAKEATERLVVQLNPADGVDAVKTVRGMFWSGYSRYIADFRGDLSFNIDRPWSLPTFGNILCHEGYPGHQAFYSHWDDLYRKGLLPLEGAYYSTAGNPANCMFEGAPETGLHFLGWDDFNENTPEITDEEKTTFAIGRDVLDLQRMLQTQACYLYHVEGASHEDVVAYMLSTGIYNPVEAENSFRFFTDRVQQYYYPCYYYGHWMIHDWYEKVPKAKRGAFFRLLYDRPHTNETFVREVQELLAE